jgi:hypothetical protein
MSEHAAPPITDSPWFWCYLFGTAALAGVLLMGPKFEARRAGLDANFTRRQALAEQRAAGTVAHDVEPSPLATEPRYVDFRPLYWVLAGGTAIGWFFLWRQRFARRPRPSTSVTESPPI